MPSKENRGKRKNTADGDGKRVKKPKKDPNAPKKPMSAYLLYCNAHREQLQKSKPDLNFGQVTSELAAKWSVCSDSEKKPFETEAGKQREAYTEAMKNYTPDPEYLKAKEEAKAAKKARKAGAKNASEGASEGDDAPSAGRSAWLIFCDQHRDRVQEANPGKGLAVVAALLADQWQSLSDTERAKCEALAVEEAKASAKAAAKAAAKPAAKKEAEPTLKKDKIKKLKAKAKQLKADIATAEKAIKNADKMGPKLEDKKAELAKQEGRLEELKTPKKDNAPSKGKKTK